MIIKHKTQGFSLTEISIVLVIIGLILAAVLGGKSLIAEAKLRATITEVEKLKVALNSFYAVYDAYPGDMGEASTFWLGATNGDDNGKIEFKQGSVYEGYNAWQHLSYARILEKAYLGTQTTGLATTDSDIPASNIKGGGYFLDYGIHGISTHNVIVLGRPYSHVAGDANVKINSLLTPQQAFEIDAKIDDSNPENGTVRGTDGADATAADCIKTSTSPDVYDLSKEDSKCALTFEYNSGE